MDNPPKIKAVRKFKLYKHLSIIGQTGINSEDIEIAQRGIKVQTAHSLRGIKTFVESHGGTLRDIVSVEAYLSSSMKPQTYQRIPATNPFHEGFDKYYRDFFRYNLPLEESHYRPALSLVEVASLPFSEREGTLLFQNQHPLIELNALAIIRNKEGYSHEMVETENTSYLGRNTSKAVVADIGSKLHVEIAGQIGRQPPLSWEGMIRDPYRQISQIFDNINGILWEIFGTVDDITEMRVWATEDVLQTLCFSKYFDNFYEHFFSSRLSPDNKNYRPNVKKIKVVSIPKRPSYADRDPVPIMVATSALIKKSDIRKRKKEYAEN